jgi:fatty acid desaturase
MGAIHEHEIQHFATIRQPTARSVLETLELPSLFVGAILVWSFALGAVPWWLYVGAIFYGGLGVLGLGYEVWRTRGAP